jgi:hypothetical protein
MPELKDKSKIDFKEEDINVSTQTAIKNLTQFIDYTFGGRSGIRLNTWIKAEKRSE